MWGPIGQRVVSCPSFLAHFSFHLHFNLVSLLLVPNDDTTIVTILSAADAGKTDKTSVLH